MHCIGGYPSKSSLLGVCACLRFAHSVTKTAAEKLGRGLNIYITDSSSGLVRSIRSCI